MLRSLVVLLLLFTGLGAGLFSRFMALQTYVFIAVFRPFEWIWWDVQYLRLSVVSGALLLVPCLVSGILPNVSHPLSIGSWIFVGLSVLAQWTSIVQYGPDQWYWTDQHFRLVVICGLTVSLLNSRERIGWFILLLGSCIGFYSAKAGVVALTGGGVSFAAGLSGAFSDNNGYAVAVNMAIPLLAASATAAPFPVFVKRFATWGLYAAIPLSALTVIGTGSRGGFVALIVVSIGYALLQKRSVLYLAGLATVATLIALYGPRPEGYTDRLSTITTYEEVGEASALGRLHFWAVAIDIAKANPLGVGLYNYSRVYDQYDFLGGEFGTYRAVHSSHFQVLAELGYLGALLWGCLFGYAIAVLTSIRRRAVASVHLPAEQRAFYIAVSTGLLASTVAFLIGGAFIALALNDITWYCLAATAAVHRRFQVDVSSKGELWVPSSVPITIVAPVVPRRRRA